jgi:hypothetical protein
LYNCLFSTIESAFIFFNNFVFTYERPCISASRSGSFNSFRDFLSDEFPAESNEAFASFNSYSSITLWASSAASVTASSFSVFDSFFPYFFSAFFIFNSVFYLWILENASFKFFSRSSR